MAMMQLTTDVLVIGGGAAGLRAALAAAEAGSRVILANKGPLAKSGTTLTAAGGLQAPFHPADSPEQFFADAVAAGYRLGDENLIRVLAEDACERALDFERYGGRLVRDADGGLNLRRFPGQSQARNLFVKGGGVGLVAALGKACRQQPGITVIDEFFVSGLITGRAGVAGACGVNLRDGALTRIDAKAVVMATGGCQWLWAVSDCPTDATGEGLIQALRAGAELVDMEMVLFYPSVLVWPPSLKGTFVHYEFLAADILDGNVYDKEGVSLLPKPLPVRDEAMRLMARAVSEGRGGDHGGVFWYAGDSPRGADGVRKATDLAQYNYLRAHGVEPATDRIEVAPGAHYLMGGIHIDENCRTAAGGLLAVPECAGNFDGANRLAGSAIIATQVFGARAGLEAHSLAAAGGLGEADPASVERECGRVAGRQGGGAGSGPAVSGLRQRLQAAFQEYAGVQREAAGLARLKNIADEIQAEAARIRVPADGVFNQQLVDVLQLDSMCDVARVVAGSALLRQESRGHHFRSDFPCQDDAGWLRHTLVSGDPAAPRFTTKDVVRL
jgi:fumarate reductase (CoM/CoB) subunit A